jgi:hypothetical protein
MMQSNPADVGPRRDLSTRTDGRASRSSSLVFAALFAGTLFAGGACAGPTQILLTPASAIGGTLSYAAPGTDNFAGSIFGQQTGPVDEGDYGKGDYWISANYAGVTQPFITVDLGAKYAVSGFELFNTGNQGAGDRGTGSFSIYGSNTLAVDAADDTLTLGGTPTLLLGATLDPAAITAPGGFTVLPIPGQTFAASPAAAFRYLQFMPLTVACDAPAFEQSCVPYGFGLNELRVFGVAVGSAPEPADWALMVIGTCLAGAALRRSRAIARKPARPFGPSAVSR